MEAEYRIPYLAHAPLEPMSVVVKAEQDRIDIWTATQIPRFMQANAARIAEIATKEEADDLRGLSLFAARDQLPGLPDDEFYHADLIGLDVYDTGGVLLGRVKTVQNHGADDLLELPLAGSSATTFLPFTKAAVPTVDLAAKRIVADPPLGVLPDGADD